MNKTILGVTFAAATALALTVAPIASFAKTAKMPCYNVKGTTGSVMKTEEQCNKAGGTMTAPDAATVAPEAAAPEATAPEAAAPATTETPAS